MPCMDVFSFLKEIRRTSRVPVLMLTARGEAEDRIEGLEIGADDYLPKPFLPKELLLRVKMCIRDRDTSPPYRVRKFVAAWLRDNNNPAVKTFTDIIESAIGRPDFLQYPPQIPTKGMLAGAFIFFHF